MASNKTTPEERVGEGPTHVCTVTASVLVPGVAGINLAPGKQVRLSAIVAPGLTLGDLTSPDWFTEIAPAGAQEQ